MKRFTTDIFIQSAMKVHGNKYNYSEAIYTGAKEKVKIYCNKCKQYFLQDAYSHLKGSECYTCSYETRWNNNNRKCTFNNVKKYIETYNFILLTIENEYSNAKTKLKIKCNTCDDIFIIDFTTFKQLKYKCAKCVGNKKLTYSEVKIYIEDTGNILLSKKYVNAKTKLKIKCKDNHIFEMNIDNFKNGRRCSVCKESNGEYKIRKWLENNNIKYEYQKTFYQCKNPKTNRNLYFDFYIPIFGLIEFDGVQHFKITGWNTKELFNGIKYRDSFKTEFAKQKNIKLLRIPYTQFKNIPLILQEKING